MLLQNTFSQDILRSTTETRNRIRAVAKLYIYVKHRLLLHYIQQVITSANILYVPANISSRIYRQYRRCYCIYPNANIIIFISLSISLQLSISIYFLSVFYSLCVFVMQILYNFYCSSSHVCVCMCVCMCVYVCGTIIFCRIIGPRFDQISSACDIQIRLFNRSKFVSAQRHECVVKFRIFVQ